MNKSTNQLVLGAALVAITLPINIANAQGSKHFPPFKIDSTCSHIDSYTFAEIHLNVNRTLEDAVLAVDYEKNSKEYSTSFGKYDQARHTKVRNRMNLIREGTYNIRITVKCETPGQSVTCNKDISKSALAWASKQDYVVNLCPRYFEATRDLIRKTSPWGNKAAMQGGIFLHELAHFSWNNSTISVGRTGDEDYDLAGVEFLAGIDPDLAVDNADSYRIFMMKLAVRNRTIYR